MYKIILLLFVIVLLNCREDTYCFFEVYQGGNVINKVCRPCGMDGDYRNIYYKPIYDNDSCSYLNTQKDKKK